jgi:hypothetical protein
MMIRVYSLIVFILILQFVTAINAEKPERVAMLYPTVHFSQKEFLRMFNSYLDELASAERELRKQEGEINKIFSWRI